MLRPPMSTSAPSSSVASLPVSTVTFAPPDSATSAPAHSITSAPADSARSAASAAPEKPFRGKWPCRIWLPGALIDLIEVRRKEVREGTLSKYFTELASYDLRERRAHLLTGRIAKLPPEVQQELWEIVGTDDE